MTVLYYRAPVSLIIEDGQLGQNKTNELVSDWNIVPFTSLKVVDGAENCTEDHPEEALYYQFSGLQELCECGRGANIVRFLGRDCLGPR